MPLLSVDVYLTALLRQVEVMELDKTMDVALDREVKTVNYTLCSD
jgi:hypothetical protein